MILKYEDGDDFYLNYEVPKVPLGGSPKETLDAIALEKDLQEIPVVDITGFNTHEEFIAYQQGRSDEEEITEKFKNKICIEEYYKLVSEWQYKLCVKPFENTDDCPPEWPPEMVKIHYEEHVNDYKTQLDRALTKINIMLEEQSDALFSYHPFQKANVANEAALESFRKSMKLHRETVMALVTIKKLS